MSNGTYWDLEASAGAAGKSVLWRGAWSSALSYNPYDAVSRSGSSYISKTNNSNADPATDGGINWDVLASGQSAPKFFSGYDLSNDNAGDVVNDVIIYRGQCRDDSNVENISLTTTLIKRLDAVWAAGTNQGGRDTGAIADGAWHLFAIMNPTTGAVDVLFSATLAPVMPSGFTLKRRIGAVIRVSNVIRLFRNYGDFFGWTSPLMDANGGSVTTGTGVVQTLGYSVPTGLKFETNFSARVHNATTFVAIEFHDPDSSATGNGSLFNPGANLNAGGNFTLMTNAAASIRVAHTGGTAAATYYMSVNWYRERRDY